jgi:hypothetical protein
MEVEIDIPTSVVLNGTPIVRVEPGRRQRDGYELLFWPTFSGREVFIGAITGSLAEANNFMETQLVDMLAVAYGIEFEAVTERGRVAVRTKGFIS